MAKPDQPAPDGTVAKKGGKLKVFIILGLVIVACSGGAFVGYSQYAQISQVAGGTDDVEVEEAPDLQPIEYGEFMQLDGLVVNPAGTGGRRFLMVTLGLESATPKTLVEIGEKDVVVRDVILRLLSEKNVVELSEIGYRDTLKDTLRTAINGVLEKGEINRLYFTKYVLQ